MNRHVTRTRLLEDAWLGDAVLALYVRARILREQQRLDGEQYARMTSNQFLSAIGEPSAVEAEIGKIYAEGGLSKAFSWIEERLIPVYERQEQKRKRKTGPAR